MDQNTNHNTVENTPVENTQEAGGRTFTQDDVNRILGERLAKEKAKGEAALAEREQALKARELAVLASEKLAEAGLPKELSSILKYDDENSLNNAIQMLSKLRGFSKPKKEEKIFIEHKLPVSPYGYDDDPEAMLRKAMHLK